MMLILSTARMSARGDEFSLLRIAFWRNGVGKKMLMALRFTMPLVMGWWRAQSSLINEQAMISTRGGATTWSDWRAALALMMTGVALWPMPRRHLIWFVRQRRVSPKFFGL